MSKTTQERADAVRLPEAKERTKKGYANQGGKAPTTGKARKESWKARAKASPTHVGRSGAGSKARNDRARLEARIAEHQH